MLSRALILAAVAFALGCFGATTVDAQNLEAGKPPSQIFSSTCSLCHKSARGLLKSVAPGSLPSFLRQHYTTSSDMAGAMSAYVLSNGAANAAPGGGNLTRQGQEAKTGPKPTQEPGPEHAAKGRKPPTGPDADGLQTGAPDSQVQTARQKAAAERRAARQAAREAAKAGKDGLPPKIEARHEAPKDEPAADAKPDAGKTEPAKDSDKSETAKVEGTRADPVPAVTPAPKEAAKPAEVAAAPPKDDVPSGPLTIDIGPAPPPPAPAVPAGPPPVPAGNPEPPISR
ncbi:MAG: hypothetical protein V4602_00355 [Pseudomonadota bacterium]